ncbi:MAG: flagellar biosynthesis protein FlgA [Halobacteriovoraceae bacterium]|nr:flagellar biosynthesis protein FlgA [Halobacteriovoraceae bacterium]
MKNFLIMIFALSLSAELSAKIRGTKVKNLVSIKGVRNNPLVGYGIVTGLNGTGDSKNEIADTTVKKLLKKLGVNVKSQIASKNIATVLVTAELPEFARVGQKINIKVSSIGDAKSLEGGNLLITPLKAGDGKIYAIGRGSLSLGGKLGAKNISTVALIPNGGIIEKEIDIKFDSKKSIRLALKNPDFTTAARIQEVLNSELGGLFAKAKDSATIDLIVPPNYEKNVVKLIAIIENFSVVSESRAKIVINERTGTIVAGGDIVIKPVAISHGDLNIEIGGDGGQVKSIYNIDKRTRLKDFVNSLNSFGVKPDDIISIFQALQKTGALDGEIELI